MPWDVTEAILISTFKQFGPVRVEWPAKAPSAQPKGYAYIIFESEKQVLNCIIEFNPMFIYYIYSYSVYNTYINGVFLRSGQCYPVALMILPMAKDGTTKLYQSVQNLKMYVKQ